MDVLHVAIEGQRNIGGFAEAAAMFQRVGDLGLDVLGIDRARKSRDRDRLDVAGFDADHLMRPQRAQHLLGRQRTCRAEVWCAVDGDPGRGAGVVDDVADPHHFVGNADIGAQHRNGDHVVVVRGERRHGRGGEQGGCEHD